MSSLFHSTMAVALVSTLACSACRPKADVAPITVARTATLEATVEPDGRMEMVAPHASWSASLLLSQWGRGGTLESVDAAFVVEVEGGARIRRSGIVEWYESTPRGVKHGFDIPAPPTGAGDIELRLALETTLEPWVTADTIRFSDASGRVRLYYDSLVVVDATGAELPSWMSVDCSDTCDLILGFDDELAEWPVTVDPLLYAAEDFYAVPGPGLGGALGLAIALDGDTAVVGDPEWNSSTDSDVGRVEIFERAGGVWTYDESLFPSSTTDRRQRFGASVDVDGDTIIVGAPAADFVGLPGEVFVFRASGATWVLDDTFSEPSGQNGDRFGESVALDGDLAVVGHARDNGNTTETGSVWVFERTGSTWNAGDRVSDPAGQFRDRLGVSVAIEGRTIVAGAEQAAGSRPGKVAVIEEGTTGWEIVEFLQEDVPEDGSRLGVSVAIFGNRIAAGAPLANTTFGIDAGRAVVWADYGMGYDVEATLLPSFGSAFAEFGASLALADDVLVVGQPFYDSATVNGGGDAVVFDYDGTSPFAWAERQHLIESADGSPSIDLDDGDNFGASVALGNDFILVGTPFDGDGGFWHFNGFEDDEDGDGFFSEPLGGDDCDDTDPNVNPAQPEVEDNGVDDDCDGLDAFCGTDLSATPGCDRNLVITEIMANPFNADELAGEWVEITNYGDDRVDLIGSFLISDTTVHQISEHLVADSGEAVVLAGSSDTLDNGGITPDYVWSDVELGDVSGGLGVRLRSSNIVEDLDIVQYTGSFSSGTSAPDGASFSLDPDHANPTDNDVPQFWCDARSSFGDGDFGTPGAPNDECDLFIDGLEFDYDGSSIVSGVTTLEFLFDSTARRFITGNGGSGTWTRTTTAGGQTSQWVYDTTNIVYTGTQAFGEDCLAGGTMSNLPPGFTSGTWNDPDCL